MTSRGGHLRGAAVTVTALLAFAAGPVEAAPRAPHAAGRTTFTAGANGGVAPFVLERAATVTVETGMRVREIEVTGGGRYAGLVIAQEGVTQERGAVAYEFRFNGCWERGCRTPADEKVYPLPMGGVHGVPEVPGDGGRTALLPPGRYTAYVIADGAPVTATIRFTTARGTTTIPARARTTTTFATAHNTVTGAAPVVYSAGAHARVESSLGILLGTMEARHTLHSHSASGSCVYAGTEPPPGGLFLPNCPAGIGGGAVIGYVGRAHSGVMAITLVRGERDWTQGIYYDGAYVAESMSPSAFAWISLS